MEAEILHEVVIIGVSLAVSIYCFAASQDSAYDEATDSTESED